MKILNDFTNHYQDSASTTVHQLISGSLLPASWSSHPKLPLFISSLKYINKIILANLLSLLAISLQNFYLPTSTKFNPFSSMPYLHISMTLTMLYISSTRTLFHCVNPNSFSPWTLNLCTQLSLTMMVYKHLNTS